MKLLHTADWHVGKTLRGRSRADEHRAVLAEIAGVARAEAVDVVLVAGDLFDSAAPAPESEEIVYAALLELAATDAQVVVVAGNHDNPRRLQAVRPLLGLGRVHVAAVMAAADAGGVLELSTRSGEVARLALLPFLSQRAIVRAEELMTGSASDHSGAYAARATSIVAALCEGLRPDAVNVAVAHLFVAGGAFGGGERSAHTIFDYCVPAVAFPAELHYVALGHLHRPQRIPAACPMWYSGSPLQLDFGETGDDTAVLVVDAAASRPAEVRKVPLRSGRRLHTVRGTLHDLMALDPDGAYLRIVVTEPPRAGLAGEVRERFRDAVDVVVESPRDHAQAPPEPARLGRAPRELFTDYLQGRGVVDDAVVALFDELHDAARSDQTPQR